jgi:acetolactate synthase-1/2/3 large subunit
VFGIPGVHTVELYRGLAASPIRHVTARHEQGAGFMADGYARAGGADRAIPGVAFVITGPGLTNVLTAMAQARADSSPMLVISSVNPRASLGRGLGYLHELPAQQAMMATVAVSSYHINSAEDLLPALDAAFDQFAHQRGGPIHIELPVDVLALPFTAKARTVAGRMETYEFDVAAVLARLEHAKTPVILVGGGAKGCDQALIALAERLNAPVVMTINARGLMHVHPLGVPASPTLGATRDLISEADLILALGTELGPTDYDHYGDHRMPPLAQMIRIDICPDQLARHAAAVSICGPLETVLPDLVAALARVPAPDKGDGMARAARTRAAAWEEIGPAMRRQTVLLNTLRGLCPKAIFVGDSTQPVYAGNLYYDHDRPGGWFNAASGFGALGFAMPAAIGVALAKPDTRVICITGDGGAQFTLPELMVAVDEKLRVLFLIWNNAGYGEIDTSMQAAGVTVVGCDPTPPVFEYIAKACGIPFARCAMIPAAVTAAVRGFLSHAGPAIIEIDMLTGA